ncbi:MAG: NAD-dependent epimerase/dehydratase family protein [Deltaproteobacteria bacterium]|nr:NAD-dependent epimerase/dehydratase family protein [Deltaproteobacteria bacterium]RLB30552.1 MAG: NAD-dependent epimerase [Deltaproteobacteria bacterium]
MKVAVVTGSGGLVGSEAVRFLAERGFRVVGMDNDMRSRFFGEEASVAWNVARLKEECGSYTHCQVDVRDTDSVDAIFRTYGSDIRLIVHAAAQPSHDWSAREPLTDFGINAQATLLLLEMTRRHCPEAVFIFTSTNKVYGDAPNRLPLVELETRWEIDPSHPYHANGIDESMSIDQSKHSLFGASKVAADILVQEYGRYFGMKTACFRGGCLTGPAHSGTELHGFLAYLMQCTLTGTPYTVYGYKGKQVRDNIHSRDLVNMFWHFYQNPRQGEVYNVGGGRHANCSVLEAISLCEEITGKKLNWTYKENHRQADHIWWISDVGKFRTHFPDWDYSFDLRDTLKTIYEGLRQRAGAGRSQTRGSGRA